MTSESDNPDKNLPFSRRYGYEPLPSPMRLEELSDDLRRELRNLMQSLIDAFSSDGFFEVNGQRFWKRVLGEALIQAETDVPDHVPGVKRFCDDILKSWPFNKVLEFLEIVLVELGDDDEFGPKVQCLFRKHGAAYWLDISEGKCLFVPSASKEQGEATQRAFGTIKKNGLDGAIAHLGQAAEHINARQYADSIADSIHAVESVARVIDPRSNNTLQPALRSLREEGVLKHPALSKAFETLYGYTSDEHGIRHALLDKSTADVALEEAIFMFGACASFAAYLSAKHRQITDKQPQP